jgi:RNA-directed DNA polymerase
MNKPKSDLSTNTEGWKAINWRQAERYVFKLQKRIFAANRCGDVKKVRKLQKTLMRSWSNRILSFPHVQDELPAVPLAREQLSQPQSDATQEIPDW